MAGLRDILRRAFGGRPPEEALAEFKERLHGQINDFKDNPESREQLQRMLQSVVRPLSQFNMFIVRPTLADNDRMKAMAQRYGVNKVELKRVLKTALELEEKLQNYFKDSDEVDQLVITLRKVVNVLDEDIVTGFVEAFDHNVDMGKIEKAALEYQDKMQKALNTQGLNRDLQSMIGTVVGNLKNAFNSNQIRPKGKASDRQADVRMLDPELQNLYNRYRDEGFEHDEAMRVVEEKKDLDGLPHQFKEAYRTLRREGRSHAAALEYAQGLAAKAQADDAVQTADNQPPETSPPSPGDAQTRTQTEQTETEGEHEPGA